MITARIRAMEDNSTLNLLWIDMASNGAIAPFTVNMLELLDSGDVLLIVKETLNELIRPQSNILKRNNRLMEDI
jgi:hypothetical protein